MQIRLCTVKWYQYNGIQKQKFGNVSQRAGQQKMSALPEKGWSLQNCFLFSFYVWNMVSTFCNKYNSDFFKIKHTFWGFLYSLHTNQNLNVRLHKVGLTTSYINANSHLTLARSQKLKQPLIPHRDFSSHQSLIDAVKFNISQCTRMSRLHYNIQHMTYILS